MGIGTADERIYELRGIPARSARSLPLCYGAVVAVTPNAGDALIYVARDRTSWFGAGAANAMRLSNSG